ncbi:MAG: hypothetical protein VX242_13925 [Pseudomonadota bacterium]|nr:hypothetical protein [Pseudomonadota bacterium]MED5380761.1 hypothetical protein [Pseudomonadota bacterium]MEE3129552.1 hypothetical protein [Pseudomonadota bacterium]MEE3273129.1 hypothetical protein [Pseudomonadota bacterium]
MSKIKQLVKKQVTESLEVKFTAESGKATFIQENPSDISSVSLFLHSNGSKVSLAGLFDAYSVDHGARQVSTIELLKGEQYSLEIIATKEKTLAKIGVFWGE